MSKEYFESLDRLYKCNDDDYTLGYQQHDYKLLQQALTRLESIDNANPSEALEKFDYIGNDIKFAYDDDYVSYDYTDDVEYIKQALIKAQEQEKVLDVLFEKRIDLFDFIRDCIEGERTDYEWYEMHYRKYSLEKLTQEEFKLLKRYADGSKS